MNALVLWFLAALALSVGGAHATQLGQAAMRNWKVMDACAKQAQTAYPEYTADSNAKREAKLKECLNANTLPPRQPLETPRSR